MADQQRGSKAAEPGRGRQRLILLAILGVAATVLAAPPLLQLWMTRDLCPTEVTAHGFAGKSGRWEIARSDCGAGRIVHQLRIVPPKSWSVLVYESERGPLPISWSQEGFVGKLELDRPLDGEANLVLDVPLDAKGRPKAPIVVRDGHRVAAP
ncbi:MAG: hypothetical protein LWW93_05045 [Hyphomicrobiales bacterium]|nr:hypothetical protein [Hyphomicrobiales bacterium]